MIIDDKIVRYVLFQRRTVAEVKAKCKALGFTDDYIEAIIEQFIENGYLNDEIYTMKYILNATKLKKKSIQELRFELMKKGIEDSLVEKYITEELYAFEQSSAIDLAKKKYKSCPDILKVKKYLLSKGYPMKVTNKAVDIIKELGDNEIER